jgi:hypothetical protein
MLKKIQSSELNKKNIAAFRNALEMEQLIEDATFIHMGEVTDPAEG